MFTAIIWESPIGKLYMGDPGWTGQLDFPPGLEIPSAGNWAGKVIHCVTINSDTGYIYTVSAALAGWTK